MVSRSLDILIVNYNSAGVLKRCIQSIESNRDSFAIRVFVWDNHSSERVDSVAREFPNVNLTVSPRNIGFSAGINALFKKSQAPYVVVLNPDCIVKQGLFKLSLDFFRDHPDVGVLGPKILNDDGTVQGSARSFPTPLTSIFGRNSPIARIFPNNSITRANILTFDSDGRTPMEVDWVSGACMVIRRDVMQAVGAFDERFFLYWEDTDLCRRIRDAGWKVVYLPEAEVIHSVGKSSSTRPFFSIFQFHKSCYRLYDKYSPKPYSIFTPIAGIALMLRFLIAAAINSSHSIVNRIACRQENPPRKDAG